MDLPFKFKQSATEGTETVDVIRIPEYGLPVEIVTVPLMRTDHLPIITREPHPQERHLTHVPNLLNRNYQDWLKHAKKHRKLIDLGNMDPEQPFKDRLQQHGPYFMYKFPLAARVRLEDRQNEHFRRAGVGEEVYGNAFIFKLKEPVVGRRDGGVVTQFENLDEASITSAFKGKGISAEESLKWLSAQ